MDIRALRYFVEVVKRQGFTAAADALYVTQPTISKMVRQIEEEAGAALLVRDGRTVRPTETGMIVYRRGLEMLELQARMEAELAEASSGMRGELAMGIPPLASSLLTPVLAEFHRLHPAVRLKLFERGSRQVVEELRASVFEIGGVLMPVDLAEFAVLPFSESPLMLIAPPGSPWQGRASVSLIELAQASFVMYGEGFMLNDMVNAACAKLGFTPRVSGQSSEWDMVAKMVEIGGRGRAAAGAVLRAARSGAPDDHRGGRAGDPVADGDGMAAQRASVERGARMDQPRGNDPRSNGRVATRPQFAPAARSTYDCRCCRSVSPIDANSSP